jgi:aminobenzoyl-glutamate utilization protein B
MREEGALAHPLRPPAKVPVVGLKRTIDPLRGAAVQKSAANDAGDISWKVPMVKFYYPANIPNTNSHHWSAGVALATSIAHKGALAGAKVLAASIVQCLKDPAIVEEAKRTFKEELGGVVYRPLLPREQKPPVDLNRAAMEKYRPLLAERHLKERPVFVS